MAHYDFLLKEELWSEIPTEKAGELLMSDVGRGLKSHEASVRLETIGLNELPSAKRDSWLKLFFRQFQSPLIYLLLGAGVFVVALEEYWDALVILMVLLFNSIIGTIQEGRAEATLDALKKITHQEVTVLRDGKEEVLEEKYLVPGDVILLKEGERVPADIKLVQAARLRVDEAPLTGESLPVFKNPNHLSPSNVPLGDRLGMVFKGTYIVGGHGQGLVVATGINTELGKISQAIISIDTEMPLKKEMQKLSVRALFAVAIISGIVFWRGLQIGQDAVTMLKVVVSMAVSIIPAGLPVVMTLVLATGVWRMAKQQAIVKRLQAVEALGQTDIIAVDKTGTVTRNELVVRELHVGDRVFNFSGEGYGPEGEVKLNDRAIEPLSHLDMVVAGRIAALSSTARTFYVKGGESGSDEWKISGDPTEAALVVMSTKIGFAQETLEIESPRLDEIPFSYEDRLHASLHRIGDQRFVAVSGAPEAIIPKCVGYLKDGKSHKLDHQHKLKLQEQFRQISRNGLRVLALGFKEETFGVKGGELLTDEDKTDYVFGGFCALEDSPRPEVAEAISKAQQAGIKVVMITGDHALTASAIATRIGLISADLSEEEREKLVLTGEEMDRLSDKSLADILDDKAVFSRVTPLHKMRLINTYRSKGKVIAMTGDGVNDAPSLVAADLGVAMGKIGTDVAKEAADIILLDDNFGTIIEASKEGRNIYQTIKKVVLYLFSTSTGEVLTIGGALFLGMANLPLLPAQILWLNLITDGFLTTALAVEPREEDLLKSTPKKTHLVDRLILIRIPFMAIPMMVGALFIFHQTSPHDITKAWALTLTTLAVFQWFNVWNCRSSEKSIFSSSFTSNPYILVALAIVISLQLAALYTPFLQTILRTTPLTLVEWLIAIGLASTIIISEETRKFIARRFFS